MVPKEMYYLLGFHEERKYHLDDNFLQKKWPKLVLTHKTMF
jgi:hypothetical protein